MATTAGFTNAEEVEDCIQTLQFIVLAGNCRSNGVESTDANVVQPYVEATAHAQGTHGGSR
jgi:hypothetical protein